MRENFFLLAIFLLFFTSFFCRKTVKNKRKILVKAKQNGEQKILLVEAPPKPTLTFSNEVYIVIFIHGTVSGMHTYGLPIGPQQTLKGTYAYMSEAFWSILKKGEDKYKKLYAHEVNFSLHKNRKSFFYSDRLPLIMGIYPGLREISLHDNDFTECTPTARHTILAPFRESFEKVFQTKGKLCKYYTFNWIGDLSLIDRAEAARILKSNLRELVSQFSGKKMKLFVFAFSHGGNVFLEAIAGESILINHFCALGMPIGRKTISWLKQASIKKLFNFFSYSDKVQVADFLFNFPNFSRRKISWTEDMKTIGKIYNIQVSVLKNKNNFPFRHHYFYFNSPNFGIPLVSYIPLFLNYFRDFNVVPYSICLPIDPVFTLNFLSEKN